MNKAQQILHEETLTETLHRMRVNKYDRAMAKLPSQRTIQDEFFLEDWKQKKARDDRKKEEVTQEEMDLAEDMDDELEDSLEEEMIRMKRERYARMGIDIESSAVDQEFQRRRAEQKARRYAQTASGGGTSYPLNVDEMVDTINGIRRKK